MEHRILNDNEFDLLWQEASARSRGQRLAEGYPQWRQNQRRTIGTLAMLAVVVAVALPMLTTRPHTEEYSHVYCNRSGIAESEWTSLASDLLMEC